MCQPYLYIWVVIRGAIKSERIILVTSFNSLGGVDHVIDSFDLTFSAESSRSCGLVSAFSDSVLEPSETFDLFIINGTSGLILEPIRATVTIIDQTSESVVRYKFPGWLRNYEASCMPGVSQATSL